MFQKLISSTLGFASSLKFKIILITSITAIVSYKAYSIGHSVGREDVLGEQVTAMENFVAELRAQYDQKLAEYQASVEAADASQQNTIEIQERIIEVEVPVDVIKTEIIEVCSNGELFAKYSSLLINFNALVQAANGEQEHTDR